MIANEITPRYQEFYQELTNRVAPHYQELREPITARHGLPRFDQSQSVSLPRFERRYFVQTVIFCCILQEWILNLGRGLRMRWAMLDMWWHQCRRNQEALIQPRQ
ncbi:hypothetical protein JOB18_029415 [Solea senegalensis]|uniref:Uncharacterized protein n=1 Tax=Solea senegalensis TaxID=28829 RepID=A0AAV6PL46_SOLSE|nr:hypothetical protein JOB18_029415 [Solea senegalensis]